MTVYPPVSVFLGDCGECQLELEGVELAEGSLASPAVVGVLDPHEDRVGELGSRGPALAVQNVLLEQRVEGLHVGVVAGAAIVSPPVDQPYGSASTAPGT